MKADKRTRDESQSKSALVGSQFKSSNTYDHQDDHKPKVPRVDSPVAVSFTFAVQKSRSRALSPIFFKIFFSSICCESRMF